MIKIIRGNVSPLLLVKKEKTTSLQFWYFSRLTVYTVLHVDTRALKRLKVHIMLVFFYTSQYIPVIFCPLKITSRTGHCTDTETVATCCNECKQAALFCSDISQNPSPASLSLGEKKTIYGY